MTLAIIIVLVAILWPVVARPHQPAYKTACSSNAKQIGMALQMYLQDYDDRLPPFAAGTMGSPVTFPALLHPYIKNGRVWRCGKDGDKRPLAQYDGSPADGTVDYGYNWLALSPGGRGITSKEVVDPAYTAALVETESYLAVPTALAGGSGASAPSARHNDSVTVGWLDGHVKAMKREVLEETPAREGTTNLGTGIDGFRYWNLH